MINVEAIVKNKLLDSVNIVFKLTEYNKEDCIFSQKYNIPPIVIIYILLQLSKDFQFKITDDFVDALEMCTFGQLETLLEKYEGTVVGA